MNIVRGITFFPLSMYLTATSSFVFLSLTSLATPKFPEPSSFNDSYRSSIRTQSHPQSKIQPKSTNSPKNFFQTAGNRIRKLMTILRKPRQVASDKEPKTVKKNKCYKPNKPQPFLWNYSPRGSCEINVLKKNLKAQVTVVEKMNKFVPFVCEYKKLK